MSEVRRRRGATENDRTNAENAANGSTVDTHNKNNRVPNAPSASRLERLSGFKLADFQSAAAFVRLMNKPMDPSCIALYRILFGSLMVVDCIHERGMSYAIHRWGDDLECRFPLFDSLRPLAPEWMCILYAIMLLGSAGIALGFVFRISCLMFIVPYWYMFLLDKTSWNNHSYLFGLTGTLFAMSDANRFWSLDGLINKKIRNTHVPLWNYSLFRFQIFIVYFIAGLKKLDADWVSGYSMQYLSAKWVFDPFRTFMTADQIDLFIVHIGGLVIDLTAGFLLFFDSTRILGTLMVSSFHLMNSRIFSIGMFPYAMLCTSILFYSADWPKKVLLRCSLAAAAGQSDHCYYQETAVKVEATDAKVPSVAAGCGRLQTKSRLTWRHKVGAAISLLYISWQCFMPYSHFLTQGYNNWTNGLYGYSWDMMVHSWSTQHIKVTYRNKDTGVVGYIKPEVFAPGHRWASHADMAKQYAACLAQRLTRYNLTNIELYFDVWMSLNSRFQQRMFDPDADILSADWHPLEPVSWQRPLLSELSDWRSRLAALKTEMTLEGRAFTDAVFFADFPGGRLEHFIDKDLLSTNLTVLKGQVVYELEHSDVRVILNVNDSVKVVPEKFHFVTTVSTEPSCYMYVYKNESQSAAHQPRDDALKPDAPAARSSNEVASVHSALPLDTAAPPAETASLPSDMAMPPSDTVAAPSPSHPYRMERKVKPRPDYWHQMATFMNKSRVLVMNSFHSTKLAVKSILTGVPLLELVEKEFPSKDSEPDDSPTKSEQTDNI